MFEKVNCIVIGAGVIGLAISRALAQAGREVIILEAADRIGTGSSSRNSEVIHAGIYYPEGGLKARHCVNGRDMLYNFCREHGVEHRKLGKLIVATNETQLEALADLRLNALANGVTNLQLLDERQCRRLEPMLLASGALLSPSTGIVDSHGLMLALQGQAESAGAMICLSSPVIEGEVQLGGVLLSVGGDAPMKIYAELVVNCAGIWAQKISQCINGVPPESIPALSLAKGNYFSLSGRVPFSRLIYPLPEEGGLGVHLTMDLGGQARFGPDVEWLKDQNPDAANLAVNPVRAKKFYPAIRKYWPSLPDGALIPGYSGLRPKLHREGEPARDFMIQGPSDHGVTGLLNLYGIESPGLTSCLSIAKQVADIAGRI